MTIAHRTSGPPTAPATPRATGAPDELVAALSDVRDPLAREVLADVVEQLEGLAVAPLGDVHTDTVVLLERRAVRALRLLDRCGTAVDAGLLRAAAADLRDPCAALLRSAARPVPTPDLDPPGPAPVHPAPICPALISPAPTHPAPVPQE